MAPFDFDNATANCDFHVPSGAVSQYGQVLLNQHESGHGGFVHLAAAFRVVDPQGVGVLWAAWLSIESASLSISSFHCYSTPEEWTGGHFDFACVWQALCGFC